MSNAYERLVRTGYVGSLKRDVLLEASRDLEYIGAIRGSFANAGDAARLDQVACALNLISELIAKDLCSLATWSAKAGSGPELMQATRAELEALMEKSEERDQVFSYFLVSTAAGDEWVRRYTELVGEL